MTTRSIFVFRHGERCDWLFGSSEEFKKRAFDEKGNYTRFDLNLPEKLVTTNNDIHSVSNSLTVMGRESAKVIGRAYKSKGITLDHVFSSPSLRCVETAAGILDGMDSKATICVEYGLYEWTFWCKQKVPKWISPKELAAAGLPVNIEYTPVLAAEDVHLGEDLEDYYERSEIMMKAHISRFPEGNILLVGHGGTLEVCTRSLSGGRRRPKEQFLKLLQHASYLGNIELRQDGGSFKLRNSPVPPLTISSTPTFDGEAYLWNEEELNNRTPVEN